MLPKRYGIVRGWPVGPGQKPPVPVTPGIPLLALRYSDGTPLTYSDGVYLEYSS